MIKRAISACVGDGDRPGKVHCRESVSEPVKREHEQIKAQDLPTPLSPKSASQAAFVPALTEPSTERTAEIYDWIPAPSEAVELDRMSQSPSKRSRARSISTDRGGDPSVSLDSGTSSGREAKSSAYKNPSYVTILETKRCFMRQSPLGPLPEDVSLCEGLLYTATETPSGTLFDEEYVQDFHNALRNRSEARLLVDLHPLLMPSAENEFIRGKEWLADVIDGYNDPWLKAEPIYGPRPQPDHARGLKWSVFSDAQRQKLGIRPNAKSPYAAREDMYFPYVTAEIKCGSQALELADRQNMHSMCVALRGIVSLAQAAGCAEQLHRRILGFSVSHELEGLRIYGYYPEISDGSVSYFRWSMRQLNIWTGEDKWACRRFLHNLDRDFLPLHRGRLMQFLAEIPDPEERGSDSHQLSTTDSQERLGSRLTASSQSRALQPELRMMIQTWQQQQEEQKAREEKLLAQLEQQRLREEKTEAEQRAREEKMAAEQRAREEKMAAEQRAREEKMAAEQRAREEKLLAQLEQQRKEHSALQERLMALLEQKDRL